MKSFEFKPLRENDLELLHHWFQEETIKQSYARGRSFTLEDIKNKYLPRIAGQENVPSFITYHDNNPIGFIQYYCIAENSLPEGVRSYSNSLLKQYSPNELAGIDCFIATAENRGKGLGREIINNFITEFLLNFKAIIVDPNKGNESAIRCYEKAGFKASTLGSMHNARKMPIYIRQKDGFIKFISYYCVTKYLMYNSSLKINWFYYKSTENI